MSTVLLDLNLLLDARGSDVRVQTPSWISLKYPNPGQFFSKIYERAFLEAWNGLYQPLTTRAIGTKRMDMWWWFEIFQKIPLFRSSQYNQLFDDSIIIIILF